ncbi:Friend virus susceptibility protein 1-like [Lepus europaeus]|uniref:Friend virus susceptibility protein 1-like n=1 Tax=Lepus europaeus TaxID=9983 RepID=UPI002B4884F0|nr:Friend virus susceptibility protein 1-like [Lepus europaeus]XP_062035073.1 Friend virus susceptibility protein 1-like [Lepus europaeus]
MGFLHWLWGFWNCLCNMIRRKDTKDSPSDGAGSTCNPWRELFLEMCRINALDCPESPLEGGQELGDSVHGTFKLLWGTREHSDAGWLLLSSLDRVVRDRDRLRDEVSRLQLRISDLRVSKSVLGESLLSCSHRAEMAENQAQALIVRLADLQRKLNSRPRRVSAVKVRALVGKEWDPVRWDGDVWEDLDEAADAEPLNPEEACLPVELSLPPPNVVPASPLVASPAPAAAAEGVRSASPGEAGMASPGAAARQSQAEAPQDPAVSPLFPCRQVAEPSSRQAPEAEAHGVSREKGEKARYSPKELLEFSALYKQKTEEQAWEWILRVWDNGGKNLKLVRAEFIDMGSLSRDPAFNLAAQGVKRGANSLFGWLAETWVKRWPSVCELEMPDLPWFTLEEGIRRLREIGMVEWLCRLRSAPLPWEGPEDALFTSAVRNRFVRGAPASLKTCVVALFCGPGLTVGTAVTQLENLNAMGMI